MIESADYLMEVLNTLHSRSSLFLIIRKLNLEIRSKQDVVKHTRDHRPLILWPRGHRFWKPSRS